MRLQRERTDPIHKSVNMLSVPFILIASKGTLKSWRPVAGMAPEKRACEVEDERLLDDDDTNEGAAAEEKEEERAEEVLMAPAANMERGAGVMADTDRSTDVLQRRTARNDMDHSRLRRRRWGSKANPRDRVSGLLMTRA